MYVAKKEISNFSSVSQALSLNKTSIPDSARSTITILGTCVSGVGINLDATGNSTTQQIQCNSGQFSAEVELSGSDGLLTLVASQKLPTGKLLQDSVSVTKDTVAPPVTISNAIQESDYAIVSGNCEMGASFSMSGDIINSSQANCQNGTYQFSVNVTPADGEKELVVQQTDRAGNIGLFRRKFLFDRTPPILKLTAPAANSNYKESLALVGDCESGLDVTASNSGLLSSVSGLCISGKFSIQVQLSPGDGPKNITLTEIDKARNKSVVNVTVIRDSSAPVLNITTPVEGATVLNQITLSGNCESGLVVSINGSDVLTPLNTNCVNSLFTQGITLKSGDGSKGITATQVDAAGNFVTVSRTVNLDASGPALTIASPANNAVAQATIVASGNCETGVLVLASGTGLSQSGQIQCNNGVYQATLTLSSGDGPKVFAISQTDSVLNKTELSRTVVRDTLAPNLMLSKPMDGTSVTENMVAASGACESGIPVIISGSGASSTQQLPCNGSVFSGNVILNSGNGAKLIEFVQTDAAGNSTKLVRSINMTAVSSVLVISQPAADSFSKGTLTIQGACDSAYPVVISGDILNSLNVPCAASAFSQNLTLTAGDGIKTVRVAQTLAGGTLSMDSRSFNKDSVAPAIKINLPMPGASGQSGVMLAGSCESGLQILISGTGVVNSSTVPCANSAFSANVSFSSGDGAKSISVTQIDLAGNSGSDSQNYVRDSVGPVLAIDQPLAGAQFSSGLTLVGKCEGALPVQVSGSGIVSGSSTSCTTGVYSIAVVLSGGEGTKSITVSQSDAAGNVTSLSRNFIRDSVSPKVAITQPTPGTAATSGITVSGTCENGLPIQISGAGLSADVSSSCSAGQYSQAVNFSNGDGSKTITVAQTDVAGNRGMATQTFVRDSQAPMISIAKPTAGSFVKDSVAMSGACESGIAVVLYGSGALGNISAPCVAGAYSATVMVSAGDGIKNLRAGQTDAANNSNSVMVEVTRDSIAPTLTILSPAAGTIAENGLDISGNCESGLPVIASGTGIASNVQAVCASGAYKLTVVFSAGDGTKQIVLMQTDLAGNTSSISHDFTKGMLALDGKVLYANNCAGCHGALESSAKIGRSALQITTAINSIGAMSGLKGLTSAQVDAISLALNSSAPQPVPVGTGLVTTFSIPIGDRNYLKSVYIDIFLSPGQSNSSSASIMSVINTQIWGQPNALGGSCTRNDSDAECPRLGVPEGEGGIYKEHAFPDALASPISDALRSGYRNQACEQILDIDGAVTNAMTRAGGLTPTSPANDANIALVYKLFYFGEAPTSELLTSIKSAHGSAISLGMSGLDAWRHIMQPLCAGSGLDIL